MRRDGSTARSDFVSLGESSERNVAFVVSPYDVGMDLARLQPTTFTSATVDASAEDLWEFIADPMLLADLSTELQQVRLVTEGPVRKGSVFEGDQLRGERRWTTLSTVTSFEPCLEFEWTVGDLAVPVSRWTFLLDQHSAGTTLTHKVTLLGGPSPLSDLLAQHPADADAVVHERLDTLQERMAVTVRGLLALAGHEPVTN